MNADTFVHQMNRYAEEVAQQPAEALKEWAKREEQAALQRDMESLAKALGRDKR